MGPQALEVLVTNNKNEIWNVQETREVKYEANGTKISPSQAFKDKADIKGICRFVLGVLHTGYAFVQTCKVCIFICICIWF